MLCCTGPTNPDFLFQRMIMIMLYLVTSASSLLNPSFLNGPQLNLAESSSEKGIKIVLMSGHSMQLGRFLGEFRVLALLTILASHFRPCNHKFKLVWPSKVRQNLASYPGLPSKGLGTRLSIIVLISSDNLSSMSTGLVLARCISNCSWSHPLSQQRKRRRVQERERMHH